MVYQCRLSIHRHTGYRNVCTKPENADVKGEENIDHDDIIRIAMVIRPGTSMIQLKYDS